MQRSPTCYVVSVPAIVGVHRTIAIVPWIFMQAIMSQKRAHIAAMTVCLGLVASVARWLRAWLAGCELTLVDAAWRGRRIAGLPAALHVARRPAGPAPKPSQAMAYEQHRADQD
jgi:hypothetical protein